MMLKCTIAFIASVAHESLSPLDHIFVAPGITLMQQSYFAWHLLHQLSARLPFRLPLCNLYIGGNAACVIDQGVDIDDAVKRVAFGAFSQSGQSCISVQRVYVHAGIQEVGCHSLRKLTKTGLFCPRPKVATSFPLSEQFHMAMTLSLALGVCGAVVLDFGKNSGP